MLFAPNPGILAAGVSAGKTYAQFQARIAVLATGGALPWATNSSKPDGSWRSTPISLGAANLWGSSWMSHFTYDSSAARIVQHGVPSQGVFDVIQDGGFEVYFEIVNIGVQATFTSLNRNGFTSLNYADEQGRQCVDLIYWDGAQAWRMNPYAGTGPTPYDW